MTLTGSGDRRSLATLLRDLADGSAQLVRHEFELARVEAGELVRRAGMGTGLVAIGAVLAVLGAIAVVTGLILLAGDQWFPSDRYWMAALLATTVFLVLGGWMALRGMDLLSPRRLVPDQTVATLKEDKEWLRQRLTSGVTSS